MFPVSETTKRTNEMVGALEREDLAAVTALLDPKVTLTVPLSFDGGQEPADRFVGAEQVRAYINGVFTNMKTIKFVDKRITIGAGGTSSFFQANGEFVAADGRPYRNVYVFHFTWQDGHLTGIEEYGNPITYLNTFGPPPQN